MDDLFYEIRQLEYMHMIEDQNRDAYLRGFKEGLKTNWRWRLYFWLQDWLNKRA